MPMKLLLPNPLENRHLSICIFCASTPNGGQNISDCSLILPAKYHHLIALSRFLLFR